MSWEINNYTCPWGWRRKRRRVGFFRRPYLKYLISFFFNCSGFCHTLKWNLFDFLTTKWGKREEGEIFRFKFCMTYQFNTKTELQDQNRKYSIFSVVLKECCTSVLVVIITVTYWNNTLWYLSKCFTYIKSFNLYNIPYLTDSKSKAQKDLSFCLTTVTELR